MVRTYERQLPKLNVEGSNPFGRSNSRHVLAPMCASLRELRAIRWTSVSPRERRNTPSKCKDVRPRDAGRDQWGTQVRFQDAAGVIPPVWEHPPRRPPTESSLARSAWTRLQGGGALPRYRTTG